MELKGERISLVQLGAVAFGGEAVRISRGARPRIFASRKTIEQIVERDAIVYGVNTGFGALANFRIPNEDLKKLQANLVRSHAASVGNPLPSDVVRAMMLLRANTLLKGNSGIRPEVVNALVRLLNKRIHTFVPEKGTGKSVVVRIGFAI